MMFTKDLSALLFVPANKEGVVLLPDSTRTVPVAALSHGAHLTSLSTGSNNATFTTENGILYSKDKKTLLACPGGYGTSVVIPKGVESITSDAFAGIALQSLVVQARITSIDPLAFSDTTKTQACVALIGEALDDTYKAVWEKAGFKQFVQPAKPGTSFGPQDKGDLSSAPSGFTYTLLPDYTLSVSWTGDSEPEADLVIPVSAEIDSVSYRVSEIASFAFENTEVRSVVIPSSISVIQEGAFKGCSSLASVGLSNGLSVLGVSAFEATGLSEVVLPATLSSLGEYVFANCSSLKRIVSLADITDIASSAIDGCLGLSIITPYREDESYAWTPGIAAQGNHVEPYGIALNLDTLVIEKDQSASLLEGALSELPQSCELSFSYLASCVSVDSDGVATGKAVGSTDVSVALVFDGIVLTRSTRSVEIVTQAVSSSDKDNLVSAKESTSHISPLPLTSTVLSLDGDAIAPRGLLASGESGGCTWDITDGKLTIRPTVGDSGRLASFGSTAEGVPWNSLAPSITSVDVMSGVGVGGSIAFMFQGCVNLVEIDLSNLNTQGLTKIDRLFQGCTNLRSFNISNFNTSNVTNMCYMFDGCASLSSIDLSNFDTSKTGWMQYMFQGCTNLESLNVSSFNTANVEGIYGMFVGCQKLASLDISKFETSKASRMVEMFKGCTSLASLDMSSFNTANVTNMSDMFNGCAGLTTLNLSNFDTSKVLYMNRMFLGCSSLVSLDVSSFTTTSVGITYNMFDGCSAITFLDLSSFDTSSVTNASAMFNACTELSSIKVGTAYTLDLAPKSGTNKAGATFTGKWVSQATKKEYDYNTAPKNVADTYTAQVGYILSFDTQAGSTAPESQLVLPGAKATSVTDPTKTGYTFGGWFTQPNGQGIKWDFATSVMPASNTTLYAQWTINSYKMSFVSNGGSGVAAKSVVYDTLTSAPSAPTKTGYTFGGWYKEAACTNLWVFTTDKMPASDVVLYAKWTANTYTVTFDSNGGTGTMAKQTMTYDVSAPLSPNTFTKTGHTFTGWATTAQGTKLYSDKAEVKNLIASGNTTLYAVWTANSYNVIFDLDGGSGVTTPIKAPFGSKLTRPSPNPTKNGYTFINWYKDTNKTALWDFAVDTVGLDTTYVYAKWTANTYAVSFHANGGAGTPMSNQTFTYDAPKKALLKNTYTKQGYTFAGWSKSEEGAVVYTDEEVVNNLGYAGTVDLYAQWTINSYTLTFDAQGGLPVPTPQSVAYATKATTPTPEPTKEGHIFGGWYKEAACTNIWRFTEDTMPANPLTLYAKWTIRSFEVRFITDGGSTIDPIRADYGVTIAAPVEPTKQGYAFAGWYRDPSFVIPWNFESSTVTDNMDLYAKWTAIVDVDVPIDPRITIDAQGKVTSSAHATKPFVSRSTRPIAITEIACTTTSSTNEVFPDETQWDTIKVSVAKPTELNKATEVRLDGKAVVTDVLEIPAALSGATSELPLTFGLVFPQETKLAYTQTESGIAIARLMYTFVLV